MAAFAAEKHVLVSTMGTGHANQQAERAVEAAVPGENIICRVPLFTAAAVVARYSDAVATLPGSVAAALAEDLGLAVLDPPVKLPRIEIYQYWHERFDRDPGNQWIRRVFARLFRGSALMRDKWDSARGGSTYGRLTVARAVANTSRVYCGRR